FGTTGGVGSTSARSQASAIGSAWAEGGIAMAARKSPAMRRMARILAHPAGAGALVNPPDVIANLGRPAMAKMGATGAASTPSGAAAMLPPSRFPRPWRPRFMSATPRTATAPAAADSTAAAATSAPAPASAPTGEFKNEPMLDFSRSENRERQLAALAQVRGQLGQTYDLIIGGKRVKGPATFKSLNPARPEEVIGIFQRASRDQAAQAVEASAQAFTTW